VKRLSGKRFSRDRRVHARPREQQRVEIPGAAVEKLALVPRRRRRRRLERDEPSDAVARGVVGAELGQHGSLERVAPGDALQERRSRVTTPPRFLLDLESFPSALAVGQRGA
jgi:hypothetical protein